MAPLERQLKHSVGTSNDPKEVTTTITSCRRRSQCGEEGLIEKSIPVRFTNSW